MDALVIDIFNIIGTGSDIASLNVRQYQGNSSLILVNRYKKSLGIENI